MQIGRNEYQNGNRKPSYFERQFRNRDWKATCVTQRKSAQMERWGAGVETQKNARGEVEGWGRVPFNEAYAPSLSTIYDGA